MAVPPASIHLRSFPGEVGRGEAADVQGAEAQVQVLVQEVPYVAVGGGRDGHAGQHAHARRHQDLELGAAQVGSVGGAGGADFVDGNFVAGRSSLDGVPAAVGVAFAAHDDGPTVECAVTHRERLGGHAHREAGLEQPGQKTRCRVRVAVDHQRQPFAADRLRRRHGTAVPPLPLTVRNPSAPEGRHAPGQGHRPGGGFVEAAALAFLQVLALVAEEDGVHGHVGVEDDPGQGGVGLVHAHQECARGEIQVALLTGAGVHEFLGRDADGQTVHLDALVLDLGRQGLRARGLPAVRREDPGPHLAVHALLHDVPSRRELVAQHFVGVVGQGGEVRHRGGELVFDRLAERAQGAAPLADVGARGARHLVEDADGAVVAGPGRTVAREELLVPFTGEVGIAPLVEGGGLIVGEGPFPLAGVGRQKGVERVPRRREEVGGVGAHLVAVHQQLGQPGGDLRRATALGLDHGEPVAVQVEEVVVAATPGPDGPVGEVVLVRVRRTVGEARDLRQVARPTVGILAGVDEHEQFGTQITGPLVLAPHQPVGEYGCGVGAAEFVTVDAVGHPGHGFVAGGRRGVGARVEGVHVAVPEAVKVGDGGLVGDGQQDQGPALVAAGIFQEAGPGRSLGQGAEVGQHLFRPEGSLARRHAGHVGLGGHAGGELGEGQQLRESRGLQALVEAAGQGGRYVEERS